MLTIYMGQQAEDVMGSLLKEYLNKPTEQANTPNICGTEAEASEGSTRHESENGEQASQCSENGKQDDGVEAQKGSDSEIVKSFVQQFKNVVAIVDPPRAGLHPTVRIIFLITFKNNMTASEYECTSGRLFCCQYQLGVL